MATLMRAMSELEVGIEAIDDAFLIEGNPARVPEMRAAANALLKLATCEAHASFEERRVSIARQRGVREAALGSAIGAALDVWERVVRARLGDSTAA